MGYSKAPTAADEQRPNLCVCPLRHKRGENMRRSVLDSYTPTRYALRHRGNAKSPHNSISNEYQALFQLIHLLKRDQILDFLVINELLKTSSGRDSILRICHGTNTVLNNSTGWTEGSKFNKTTVPNKPIEGF